MKKLPFAHTLRLGGHAIKVRFPKVVAVNAGKGLVTMGRASTPRGIIEVGTDPFGDGGTTHRSLEQVYLHEVVHVLDEIFNGGTLKESQVEAISQGLLAFLRQTPVDFRGKKKVPARVGRTGGGGRGTRARREAPDRQG